MIATISPQAFEIRMKVNKVRVSFVQDINADNVSVKLTFLATHWVDSSNNEVLMFEPVIIDEKSHTIPFGLWVLLRSAVSNEQLIDTINENILPFNSEFYGSMAGFNFQIESVELG